MVNAVAGLIDRHGTPHQRLRLRQAVGGKEQRSQAAEIPGHVGMVIGEVRLIDRQGTAHQRLRLRQAVGGQQQQRQVVENPGHVRIVLAVAGLMDGQGPAIQRFRLCQAVDGLQQQRQVAEIPGHVGMNIAVAGLIDRQGPAIQRLRLRWAVGGLQERRQVVQIRRRVGMIGPTPDLTPLQSQLRPPEGLVKVGLLLRHPCQACGGPAQILFIQFFGQLLRHQSDVGEDFLQCLQLLQRERLGNPIPADSRHRRCQLFPPTGHQLQLPLALQPEELPHQGMHLIKPRPRTFQELGPQ